jgi:hypothetical protein
MRIGMSASYLDCFVQCPPLPLTHLHLSIGPSWHLNNHVEDGLLLVGIKGNVVEGRARNAVLLDVDAVLEGVGSADLACRVHGGSLAGVALFGNGKRCHIC